MPSHSRWLVSIGLNRIPPIRLNLRCCSPGCFTWSMDQVRSCCFRLFSSILCANKLYVCRTGREKRIVCCVCRKCGPGPRPATAGSNFTVSFTVFSLSLTRTVSLSLLLCLANRPFLSLCPAFSCFQFRSLWLSFTCWSIRPPFGVFSHSPSASISTRRGCNLSSFKRHENASPKERKLVERATGRGTGPCA